MNLVNRADFNILRTDRLVATVDNNKLGYLKSLFQYPSRGSFSCDLRTRASRSVDEYLSISFARIV